VPKSKLCKTLVGKISVFLVNQACLEICVTLYLRFHLQAAFQNLIPNEESFSFVFTPIVVYLFNSGSAFV
jgi:hypothetical protein